jgi:hypothetical protein
MTINDNSMTMLYTGYSFKINLNKRGKYFNYNDRQIRVFKKG